MNLPFVLFGLGIIALGAMFILGAECIRALNFRMERWGPAWQRRFRRWVNERFVRPRAFVWSYRLVGAAWIACGVLLVLGGLSRQ
jgi:hypothetical protein